MPSGAVKPLKAKRTASTKPVVALGRDTDATASDLLRIVQPILPHLEQVEQALTRQVDGFDPSVQDYVRYALEGHGKRLRPVLALLAGGAGGKIEEAHIELGVIVELVHLATLLHDDVIDEATMRRSRPTANARWGNEISVLVGDCLFARALELAATRTSNEVCRRISEATNTVCAGEILQIRERFNFELTLEEYLRIVEMKTGALFAVSCELGAKLSGADAATARALRGYGLTLGTAYQIYDDCVDIFGNEPQAGKSLGTDVDSGKLTLPLLLHLKKASDGERRRLRALLIEDGRAHREQLALAASGNGGTEQTLELIRTYTEQAAAQLKPLRSSTFVNSLSGLANFLYAQSCKTVPTGGRV